MMKTAIAHIATLRQKHGVLQLSGISYTFRREPGGRNVVVVEVVETTGIISAEIEGRITMLR